MRQLVSRLAAALSAPLQRRRTGRRWRAYDRAWGRHFHVAQRLAESLGRRPYLSSARSIFSIGPGRGQLELLLLDRCSAGLGYAEPDVQFAKDLERDALRLGHANRIGERQGAFDPSALRETYDVILSVHSWYSWGTNEEMLQATLRSLAPGGTLVVVLWSSADFFVETGLAGESPLTLEHFSQWLSRLGIDYTAEHVVHSIPMQLLVRDGGLTSVGEDVVTFFSGSPGAGRDARTRLGEMLEAQGQRETLSRVHGVIELSAGNESLA